MRKVSSISILLISDWLPNNNKIFSRNPRPLVSSCLVEFKAGLVDVDEAVASLAVHDSQSPS